MIEMKLARIILHENKHDQIIVLREKNGKGRDLPIVIGVAEAAAIKMRINKIIPPRPLTHDLLKNVIEDLGFKINKIIIDKLESGTFYAKIVLSDVKGGQKQVDARPSDAVALAIRAEVPIYVEQEVLDQIQMLGT